jgi:streptogrisin B
VRTRSPRLLAAAALAVLTALAAAPDAGAAPQYGAARLGQVRDAVADASVEGTAWYVDRAAGRVVVTADSTVTRAGIAKIKRTAGADAGALKIERTDGVLRPLLTTGDPVYGAGYRCSVGFNVRDGQGTYYFLTAGHCGSVVDYWYADPGLTIPIGPTVSYAFPGDDFALVRYDNPAIDHPGGYQAAYAYVGERVTRTGSTTGTHGGTVTGINVCVNYGGGDVVCGLIQTNVCAEPGDSGGALTDGTKALGLASGGSGNCTSGGTSFYQPVPEVVQRYGLTVY